MYGAMLRSERTLGLQVGSTEGKDGKNPLEKMGEAVQNLFDQKQ